MISKEHIFKPAVLGTDRTTPPAALREALSKVLPIADDIAPEQVLLLAAGWYYTQHKAGYEIPKVADINIMPPPAETRKEALPVHTKHLEQILRGRFPELLHEYIRLCADAGYLLPTAFIPDVLNFSFKSPKLWPALRVAAGAKGQWLAAMNPNWFYIMPAQESDWQTGSHEQRVQFLSQLRLDKPAEALNLLEDCWAAESNSAKLKLLQCLKQGLSAKDESFLETLLDYPTKDIRAAAQGLLAQIPQSAFNQRMKVFLQDLLGVKSNLLGKKLQVKLPEEASPTMLRNGIDPKKTWPRSGEKASILGQMIQTVEPDYWSDSLGLEPEKLVYQAMKSDYALPLILGWMNAATLHRNDTWLMAIFNVYLEHPTNNTWIDTPISTLLEALSEPAFNQYALKLLKEQGNALGDKSPIMPMLLQEGRSWSEPLAKRVVIMLAEVMQRDKYVFHWGLKSLFRRLAFSAPAIIWPNMQQYWPATVVAEERWKLSAEEALVVLKFRHEYWQSFTN